MIGGDGNDYVVVVVVVVVDAVVDAVVDVVVVVVVVVVVDIVDDVVVAVVVVLNDRAAYAAAAYCCTVIDKLFPGLCSPHIVEL